MVVLLASGESLCADRVNCFGVDLPEAVFFADNPFSKKSSTL